MVASAVATPSPESKSIMEMEFERMEPFPNHKFKLYEGQQLADMVESIRQFGILIPIILWHREDDTYVILSGHNRCNAAKIAGFTKGPVIIKENLSCDEAVLIVTETNLRQRSFTDMSHSERAYCLAQHYEALKSQGKRSDLLTEIEGLMSPHDSGEGATSVQLEQKLESREKVGQEYGLSSSKVGRYIKISSLIEPLLMCVDTGEIAFLAAYDLAFVADTSIQQQIADLIQLGNYKVDMRKARLLRSCYEAGEQKKCVTNAVSYLQSDRYMMSILSRLILVLTQDGNSEIYEQTLIFLSKIYDCSALKDRLFLLTAAEKSGCSAYAAYLRKRLFTSEELAALQAGKR